MRRRRFEPSPTYGKPHPGYPGAVEVSMFMMSLYDAAPEYIRKRDHNDGTSVVRWFYQQQSDPRPVHARLPVPKDCEMPPFPWDESQLYAAFDTGIDGGSHTWYY